MSARPRNGFTLIELLVVILVVLAVSAVALTTIVPAYQDHTINAAASQIQVAIHAARDQAMNDGRPAGFRLIPDKAIYPDTVVDAAGNYVSNYPIDPSKPLAYAGWVPLVTPGDYSAGLVSIFPYNVTNPYPLPLPSPVLVLEQCLTTPDGVMAEPTAWYWNLRVGERVKLGTSREYTIVGPVVEWNAEGFVNIGPAGTVSPLDRGAGPVEYLFLVNGLDDDHNGYVDDLYDGMAERIGPGIHTVQPEVETWETNLAGGTTFHAYSVKRRPAPKPGAMLTALPSSMVIDATGWANPITAGPNGRNVAGLRSRIPVDPQTGVVDVILDRSGQMVLAPGRSSPTIVGLLDQTLFFWVCPRSDVGLPPKGDARLAAYNGKTGRIAIYDPAESSDPYLGAAR